MRSLAPGVWVITLPVLLSSFTNSLVTSNGFSGRINHHSGRQRSTTFTSTDKSWVTSRPRLFTASTWRSDHTYSGVANILSIGRGGSGSSGSSTTTQLESTAAFVAVDSFLKSNPLIAAAMVCAIKATLADLVAQQRQIRGKLQNIVKMDFRRTLAFVVYGALYQGMAQELIYNNLYTYLFGSATTPLVVFKKVMFDAIFHNALVCIPMAYAVKAFVFQYSLRQGIKQYIDDVRHHGLLLKYYTLWMPVNAMLFTIVPKHWRITVMATVSFFWMIILSTISSRSREENN